MKYLHISKQAGTTIGPGITCNVGRNAAKRELRKGKPRKHWRSLPRT